MKKLILIAVLWAFPLGCFAQDAKTQEAQQYSGSRLEKRIIEIVKQDLAINLNISKDSIQVKSVEKVVWPDSALGFPEKGRNYLQVVTEGYRIVLFCNGQDYEYHTNAEDYNIIIKSSPV